MKGFIVNIEKTTLDNSDYRRVLYTAKHSQLVLMNIQPGDEIGEEVHHLDQFIRLEAGQALAVLDGEERQMHADDAVIVPEGVKHNFINNGTEPLKLYTVYSPPEHKDGIVEATKADEIEEHFDGVTTN